MAHKQIESSKSQESESLIQAFFRGFLWPLKMIWRGLVWLTHQPPLKQIGHGLRRFGRLRPVRFLGRVLGIKYLYESYLQLRQVTWPTFRESRKLTSAVIIFSIIFGLYVALIDYGLDKIFKQFILK